MPHWAFIVAAQFAFFGLILLWLWRMLSSVSRLISTTDDYIAAILTFVVMLTGCLALGKGFHELNLLHFFTVELLMIYFPFSCLMHAFTFIPSRAFTGAWFGRRGGILAQPRNLLEPITENFVEMTDHGRMNWCCGGGVSGNERAHDLKNTVFNKKKSQIEALEVDAVVTACSNCRMVMEEGLEANEMDIPLLGLT